MNKKILIGSIIAVVILVLVSFTGVVGYQTTKSSTIARASPLFNIRTSKAINRDSKDLTCNYAGKGEDSVLSIPKRDNRIEMVKKVIDVISKIDDKTFTRFIGLIINRMKQNGYTDIDNAENVNAFNLLKTNQEAKGIILTNSDKPRFYTQSANCTFVNWKPSCFLIWLLMLPFAILEVIGLYVEVFTFVIFTILIPGCNTQFCP